MCFPLLCYTRRRVSGQAMHEMRYVRFGGRLYRTVEESIRNAGAERYVFGGAFVDNSVPVSSPIFRCDEFTHEMRVASYGKEYDVGTIHDDGETLSFTELVKLNNDGLVDWYCKKMEYDENVTTAIKENKTIRILGAFVLRYKAFCERFSSLITAFDDVVNNPDDGKYKYIKKLLSKQSNVVAAYYVDGTIPTTSSSRDIVVQLALERTHCILFYGILNKGVFPRGFAMETLVEQKANTPLPPVSLSSILLSVERVDAELATFPPYMESFTFGLVWGN